MSGILQDLRDYSLSYQHSYVESGVLKDSFIEELHDLALNDGRCIILEGTEGIGKTQVLLQFAERHKYDCFSYFVNPACQFTYKLDYLMEDLGKQIYFHKTSQAPPIDLEFSESNFRDILFKLISTPGRKNKPLFFVLDGLDQMNKSDFELIRPIITLLPWAINNFYFIVSGDRDKLKDVIPDLAYRKSKSIRLLKFSFEESRQLFSNCADASVEQIKDIHDTWNGHPERLAQIKRIIESGISIDSFLIRDDIKQKNDLLNAEWEQADLDELDFCDDIIRLISIMAFDENARNLTKILKILDNSSPNFKEIVKSISFISLKGDEVSFVSNSFQVFVSQKLKVYKSDVIGLLIAYYANQESLESILNLSSLYAKKEEWKGIIKLLTLDNLSLVVSNSRSFAEIRKQINNGFSASRNLGNSYSNLLRFSLYRSTLTAFQRSDTKEAQLSAYAALGKADESFALISNATLKEDRLRMFITYAKELNSKKEFVSNSILREIKDLLESVDIEYIKENATDVILGLAQILPEEAVKMVEKISGVSSNTSSFEWLLSYVSAIAAKSKEKNESSIKVTEKSYLDNNFVDKFAKSIGHSIGEESNKNIISVISKVENTSDKVYMLRRWIRSNSFAVNIFEIINFTLDLLLEDAIKNKPTTTILLDIVHPLVNINNEDDARKIINRIDSLLISVTSPTEDKIQLQKLIIERFYPVHFEEASVRALELYKYIDKLEDFSTKATALSHCLVLVYNLNSRNYLPLPRFLLEEGFVKSHILDVTDALFISVAEQYEEIVTPLEILSHIDLRFALSIVDRINTWERRSYALLKCLSTYVDISIAKWDVDLIVEICDDRISEEFYDKAILSVFDAADEQLDESVLFKDKIVHLLPLISKVNGNQLKSYLITKAILILSKVPQSQSTIVPKYGKLVNRLSEHLSGFFNKIDTSSARIEVGYRIAAELANSNKVLAEEYFALSENLANDTIVNNDFYVGLLINSIRLAIRAYCGVLEHDKNFSYSKVSSMISYVPSTISKISLWSELAMRASLVGAKNVAEDIVEKRLLPQLEKYKLTKDHIYFFYLLKISSTAIHSAQPDTLKLYIEDLTQREKEEIVSSVCYVLLTHCFEFDPFDEKRGNVNFSYQNATQYLDIIKYVSTDNLLYYHISNICSIPKRSIDKFTIDQKIDITSKLQELIKSKLPNPETGISHIGYLIVSEAAIQKFSVELPSSVQSIIDGLISKVSQVPNTADRAYIYSLLSVESSVKRKKVDLINKAFEEADSIISIKEKIQRYEAALDIAHEASPEIFKNRLRQIHSEVYKLDESEMFPTYQKLIDLAYKYDKTLAQKLINDLDSDPARQKMAEPANNHMNKLEAQTSILTDYSKVNSLRSSRETGKVMWQMLGELNAGTRVSRDIEQTLAIINSASRISLFYAFPSYEFFIQNSIKHTSSNKENLLSIYDATISNADLCYNLIGNLSSNNSKNIIANVNSSNDSFIAKPGLRIDALDFIASFLRESESKSVYIIDSHFSEKDIIIIKNISEWCYGATINVITSCEAGQFSKVVFDNAWKEISAEEFPLGDFVSVSNQFNKAPFENTYIILSDKLQGLRIGIPFHLIGIDKTTEISSMYSDEVKEIYNSIIIPIAKGTEKEYGEHILRRETFQH